MDDAQRTIVGTLGGALVVAGLTWAAAVGSTSWEWRTIPAVGMVVFGAVLLVLAWPDRSSWRTGKRRAIKDGRDLIGLPRVPQKDQLIGAWQTQTYLWLRSTAGLSLANKFTASGNATNPDTIVAAQVTFLEQAKRPSRKLRT